MTSKNKKLFMVFLGGSILILIIAGAIAITATGAFGTGNKICTGVTIGGLDVGGLTKKDAKNKLDAYQKKLENRKVTIAIDDQCKVATAGALGFSCNEKDTINKAYAIGKKGNIFSRMKAVEGKDKKLELTYKVDENVLQQYLLQNCKMYEVKVKNSKLKLVNGKFKATKSHNGRKIQIEDTIVIIKSALLKNVSEKPIQVDAVLKIKKAKYTQKMVSKCKDVLGKYATSYATSTRERANNVRTAAKYINGTVLYPGETFSVIKTIKDRTEANGYQAAPEYSSGNVVKGIGGGVCQVSTTLYNAVINAELKIVERSPHSMVVAYVDKSRDAAISGTYKDFKFKNNTKAPIYISAVADGSTLSFKIYGEETRAANRTIKFVSEVLEVIQPGNPQEDVDATKPASYRVVTQSAHVGYRARLWKLIYIDGKQTDKVLINSSSYSAEPEHITVGKKIESPTPAPATSAAPNATLLPQASQKPGANQTQKPTNSNVSQNKTTTAKAPATQVTKKPVKR